MAEQQQSFTPGPWVADLHNEQRDGGRFITYVRGGNQLVPIAAVPTGVEGYGREEGRANARLIAATPVLYKALEAIVDYDLPYSEDPEVRLQTLIGFMDLARSAARAAIASSQVQS